MQNKYFQFYFAISENYIYRILIRSLLYYNNQSDDFFECRLAK